MTVSLWISFLFLLLFTVPGETETRPDWIPVGAVTPQLERHALSHREFLQNRSGEVQRQGLRAIRSDLDRFDLEDLRIAVVPLVVDMLGMEYRILSVSSSYLVDSPTRVEALTLLADIGGEQARRQLRETIDLDRDSSVRATAAALLSRNPGEYPDEDLLAIARALQRATRLRESEEELRRLLVAVERIIPLAWNREPPELLQALQAIVTGPYSSSLRRFALSMLEDLARR